MKKNLPFFIAFMLLVVVNGEVNAQYNYDSVNFEAPVSTIIIEASANNNWQIGTPSKTYFDAAHSGTKAILTDTINPYLPHDTSVFIYTIRNPYTLTCYTSMEYWHKFDTDTLTDIGLIDASYDGGNSWITVSDTGYIPPMGSEFWWDSDYHQASGQYQPHPLITSGKSDGWIRSRFNWQWWIPVKSDTIIVPPDSLMIRFTFISDDVETNKEGWMIDDIVTYSADWNLCSGTENQNTERHISIMPNPFSNHATLTSNTPLNDACITIYNISGQLVRRIEGNEGTRVIVQRDNLSAGLYYLVVTEKNKILASTKFMITD